MQSLRYKFVKNNIFMVCITIVLVIILVLPLALTFEIYDNENTKLANFLGKLFLLRENNEESLLGHIYFGIIVTTGVMLIVSVVLSCLLLHSLLKSLKIIDEDVKSLLDGNMDFTIMLPQEKELADIVEKIEGVRLKLKAEAERKEKFEADRNMIMASISHDLKTPITSIKGYLEAINAGMAKDSETMERYLNIVHAKSKVLEQLAENMADYSELELGRMQFSMKFLDFSELIDSFSKTWRMEMAEQKRVLLENITEKELLIAGDEVKLKRVFDNLISNAIKYSKEGSEILVSLEEAEKGALLVVSDNGKGIKTEDLRNIFDGFFRGDAARTEVRGNGLGLSIAKQIIENHRGKIWIRSEHGVGTQVYVYIPTREKG